MKRIKVGLLSKKRGNYKLQERLSGKENVIDLTNNEVEHHKHALLEAGFDVKVIGWDSNFIKKIRESNIASALVNYRQPEVVPEKEPTPCPPDVCE